MRFASRNTLMTSMRRAAALLGLALLLPQPVQSQVAPTSGAPGAVHDDRWQPWLGCWSPAGSITPLQTVGAETTGAGTRSLLCVVPGETPTSVQVVNFSGGTIVDRTVIETGRAIAKRVDECSGTETATWSQDGRRLMLRGTFDCGRGVQRIESGLMSIDTNGEWVQTQSVSIGGNVNTFVAHFRDTGIALEGIENGAIVERPLLDETGKRISPPRDGCEGTDAVNLSPDGTRVTVRSSYTCAGGLKRVADAEFVRGANARWERVNGPQVPFATASVRAAAGAPVTTDDIMEVAKSVDKTVAEAWISDRGQQFYLTGKELVRLADGGMPSNMIDMLVAMSNPLTFTLRRTGTDGVADVDPTYASRDDRRSVRSNGCGFIEDYCYGMLGLGWLYGADRYYGWNAYGLPFNRFGYGNGWGYGFGGGFWGPGYYNGGGPIVVIGPSTGNSGTRGRAVYGQGYTRDQSGSGSTSRAQRPITFSSPTSSSGSSGGSPSGSSSSGSSSGSSSSGRTAKPRGGGQ